MEEIKFCAYFSVTDMSIGSILMLDNARFIKKFKLKFQTQLIYHMHSTEPQVVIEVSRIHLYRIMQQQLFHRPHYSLCFR